MGGKYIFGDNVMRTVWALDETTTPFKKTLLCVLPRGTGPNAGTDYTSLSSFGTDADGEIYLCQMSSIGGRIYKLQRGGPPPADLAQSLKHDDEARINAAVPDADPLSRWAYRMVLLDSLVHELNAMRGVMGEPDRLEFADIRETGLTAIFKYGATQCILAWVDLPSIARYSMEFAFHSPTRRLTLSDRKSTRLNSSH